MNVLPTFCPDTCDKVHYVLLYVRATVYHVYLDKNEQMDTHDLNDAVHVFKKMLGLFFTLCIIALIQKQAY